MMVALVDIPYSRNLSRKKTFAKFEQNWGAWHLLVVTPVSKFSQ